MQTSNQTPVSHFLFRTLFDSMVLAMFLDWWGVAPVWRGVVWTVWAITSLLVLIALTFYRVKTEGKDPALDNLKTGSF